MAQTIDNTLGETVNYGYDYLHRLTAATATNGTWGEAYAYDGFGNLTGKTPTQGYAPAMTGSADSNATGGALSGQWDVEKRPMTQAATQGPAYYVYDPWGRRIWKQWYNTTYGTTNCEAYFYGATGQKLESYSCTYSATSLGATLQGINTYFAGKMLSEKGVFIATDRLGSVRGDSNGVSMSYYPWGEERGQGTTDGRTKFAGYFRDMPGQDYAMARYYSAASGSFWSPDPGGVKTADPSDPSSWNRYPYTGGDPLNFVDPGGELRCNPEVPGCSNNGQAKQPFCDLHPTLPACQNGNHVGTGPTTGGLPGKGNTGGTSQLSNAQLLPKALLNAYSALNHSDCASIFGTPPPSQAASQPPTASGELAYLIINNDVGFSALPSGTVAQTNQTVWSVFGLTQPTITINTIAGSGYWNAGNAADNADTLLHELGHVLYLLGWIGDQIVLDPTAALNAENEKTITDNCAKYFVTQ